MNQKSLLLISIPVVILAGLVIDDNLQFGPDGYCMPDDESCKSQLSEETKEQLTWEDTQISIETVEASNDQVTVTISILGPADHWRIILDEEFPIGEANSIEGQGVGTATTQYTFYSLQPGEHVVRVAAVTPSHQLAGEIVSQSFTINEAIIGKHIIINGQQFSIFQDFIVNQLTEDDFIGLYDNLQPNQVILFTYGRSTYHEYFNDHVPSGTDILWLNARYEIIHLESVVYCENADQMNYLEILENCQTSRADAKFLIETHSGFIENNNIKLRDKVELRLFEP